MEASGRPRGLDLSRLMRGESREEWVLREASAHFGLESHILKMGVK
jgi:hypothetical protein